jgi:hypothetical protein
VTQVTPPSRSFSYDTNHRVVRPTSSFTSAQQYIFDMSLLERVTSFESLVPDRGSSRSESASSRDRKLSFSPLPESWDPPIVPEGQQPIGAFEVPYAKRVCKNLPISSISRNLLTSLFNQGKS